VISFATQKTKGCFHFEKKLLKPIAKRNKLHVRIAIAQLFTNDFKSLSSRPWLQRPNSYWRTKLSCEYRLLAKAERKSATLNELPSSDWIYKEPYVPVWLLRHGTNPFHLAFAPMIAAIAAEHVVV